MTEADAIAAEHVAWAKRHTTPIELMLIVGATWVTLGAGWADAERAVARAWSRLQAHQVLQAERHLRDAA